MIIDTPEQIALKIGASRKYRDICPETLQRITRWALDRHPKTADAVKAAKRKLHQVYGAYVEHLNHSEIESLITQSGSITEPGATKRLCEKILLHHASTAERLPSLSTLYKDIFSTIGSPRSILDIACGLNPFTIPWMNLENNVSYIGMDIDCRLCSVVNRFLSRYGDHRQVHCRDVLSEDTNLAAEAVFLFKTLPCLEQQVKGISRSLLCSINTSNLVISFPTGSLCGKKKGMTENYSQFMGKITAGLNFKIQVLTYPTEVFYILTRSPHTKEQLDVSSSL